MYFEPRIYNGRPVGSLCFNCKNAVPNQRDGCSWSLFQEPVEGWDALYIENVCYQAPYDSFCVRRCPQFHMDVDLNKLTCKDVGELRLYWDDGRPVFFTRRGIVRMTPKGK